MTLATSMEAGANELRGGESGGEPVKKNKLERQGKRVNRKKIKNREKENRKIWGRAIWTFHISIQQVKPFC